MLLIVNADDLGTSSRVNDETFALMEAGIVTSATLIANAPGFAEAARRSRDYPQCSFGVHLNLSALRPIGPIEGLESILDDRGQLSQKLFQVAMPDRDLRAAMVRELETQVQCVLDSGVAVSHFDSHQHVHTIPQLFPVFKAVQRRFGVRKIRRTRNLLEAGRKPRGLRAVKKGAFSVAQRYIYASRCPDGFGDFRDFYDALQLGHMPRFRSLELMVHPGTSDRTYQEEIEQLRSGWPESLPKDVELRSYLSL